EAERVLELGVAALLALPEARAMRALRVWAVRAQALQAPAARALVARARARARPVRASAARARMARASAVRVLDEAAPLAMRVRREPRAAERAPAAIRAR